MRENSIIRYERDILSTYSDIDFQDDTKLAFQFMEKYLNELFLFETITEDEYEILSLFNEYVRKQREA